MIDFSSLPFSEAERVGKAATSIEDARFTFHENKDERKIYNDINKRLGVLETAVEIDEQELASIRKATDSFRIAIDEKEEVLLRVDWLSRLYKVKKAIQSVDTKEHVERLRTMITGVQTCPLKIELMNLLNEMMIKLPSEKTEQTLALPEKVLMEKSIEEAGDIFINLGKEGRNFIIGEVLKKSSKKATIEAVQKYSKLLEQRVEVLRAIKEPNELINQLESLPVPSFNSLPGERKVRIAERLLENNIWNGLASLDRMIAHLDKAITKEEQQREEAKNTIITSDGKAALTLNIMSVEDGRVQLD